MNPVDPITIHIIADFFGCDLRLLERAETGEEILRNAIRESGLQALVIKSHQFEPAGYTAVAMLTESHVTLHTWPELGSVLLDIFTCAEEDRARIAFNLLEAAFKPDRLQKRILHRGARDPERTMPTAATPQTGDS